MSKKPTLYDFFNDDSLWGNQTAGDLSHEDIVNKNWDRISENNRRWSDPKFREKRKQSLDKVIQSKEWQENQKLANKKMRTPEWVNNHNNIMQELYKTDKWKKAVFDANQNPSRNKKISEKHKLKITTPDGIFTSVKECSNFYGITTEGIRYRCKTDPTWIKENNTKLTKSSLQKKSLSASISTEKRLSTIAEQKGYIITPYGKFLSVRAAWKEEQKHNNVISNPHNWFLKMHNLKPNEYYKIIE